SVIQRILVCFVLMAPAIIASACATATSAVKEVQPPPSPMDALIGEWVDRETSNFHTIVKKDDGYEVVSIIGPSDDGTGEKMEILQSEWKDGVLTWRYHVPSTGYTVDFKTVSVNGDELKTEWANDDGNGEKKNGEETLYRKGTFQDTDQPEE
ncbi:MAG TPA: hypothetical protein VF857_05035, partial [Spirochaetota bacterium]